MPEQGKTPVRGAQPESDYEWLELADFTAGCYDYSAIANSHPNIPAQGHALDASETWGCIGLPEGGLGPLPGVDETYTWPAAHGGGTTVNYITGMLVHDEIGATEAILMVEYDDGTNHSFDAGSLVFPSTWNDIVNTTNPSGGLNEFPFGSPYPQMTRMAATDPTTTPGNPVCVFPAASFAIDDTAGAGQIYVYPNPATPTSFTPLELITTGSPQSLAGMILVHQSRVIVLANASYGWPAGSQAWVINEEINYTDPPNSTTYPPDTTTGQQTVAVAEEPYGFGCGGSISAGELFLVKRRGGGVVINGDIFDPTITFLPGVQPTGQGYGNADSGMAGLFYCSIDEGAWLWNGSNTSQKVSGNLDDNFFQIPQAAIYLSWYVKCVADKVYFSNNWMLDLRTNAWWKYYPSADQGGMDLFWIQAVNGPYIYCAPLTFFDSNLDVLLRFNESVPAEHWQAHTLPIRTTNDRYVEIRRVIVRATSNNGNASGTVSVQIYNGTTMVGSATTPNGDIKEYPTMINMPVGAINAGGVPYSSEDITVRIVADGNSAAAPNVHSVSLGWAKRAHSPTVGVSS